jgi:DNA-directed RNA polymerase specialized sigma subunit
MKEFLYEALALLNEEDEAILRLLYLSDRPASAKEYGEMLGICESYVHKKKTEALKRLKIACSWLRYKKLLRNADEVES